LSDDGIASGAKDSAAMLKLILAKIGAIDALNHHRSLPMDSTTNLLPTMEEKSQAG
jgi:hypothetical protein